MIKEEQTYKFYLELFYINYLFDSFGMDAVN